MTILSRLPVCFSCLLFGTSLMASEGKVYFFLENDTKKPLVELSFKATGLTVGNFVEDHIEVLGPYLQDFLPVFEGGEGTEVGGGEEQYFYFSKKNNKPLGPKSHLCMEEYSLRLGSYEQAYPENDANHIPKSLKLSTHLYKGWASTDKVAMPDKVPVLQNTDHLVTQSVPLLGSSDMSSRLKLSNQLPVIEEDKSFHETQGQEKKAKAKSIDVVLSKGWCLRTDYAQFGVVLFLLTGIISIRAYLLSGISVVEFLQEVFWKGSAKK